MGATSPAKIAITVMTTRSSIRVKPVRSDFRHTQHLFDSRDPRLHLAPPVLPERDHPLLSRQLAQRAHGCELQELLLQLLRDDEQLEDPGAAAVARVSA